MPENFNFDAWITNAREAVHDIGERFFPVPQQRRREQGRASAGGGPFRSTAADGDRNPFTGAPFFTSQGPAQSEVPPPSQNQGAPPASRRAIRQLPTIRVSPEDLVEPSNRECCICLEENCLGEKVTRLPCAHIFHEDCIIDWLSNHHCTCPVCRYELPTDYPMYEAGRLERMKTRKPRYAMYELKRMSIPDLLALNKRPAPGVCEKEELIQMLIRDERIDLVPAPEPVEYELNILKEMKIRKLKQVMEEAGVFFHAKDVVEKNDMLTIFLNSGRLSLLPSKEGIATTDNIPAAITSPSEANIRNSLSAKRPFVETVFDSDGDYDIEVDESLPPPEEMFSTNGNTSLNSRILTSPVERGVASLNDRLPSNEENGDRVSRRSEDQMDIDLQGEAPKDLVNERLNAMEQELDCKLPPKKRAMIQETVDNDDLVDKALFNEKEADRELAASISIDDHHISRSNTNTSTSHTVENIRQSNSEASVESDYLSANSQLNGEEQFPFQEYSIAHLQELSRINKVDVSSCFERGEMVNLLVNAGVTMKHPSELFRESLSRFSVSILRALASEVDIDLSLCNDKEDMLHLICHEAIIERPHLQSYLRALSPLATLSLNELRRTAREWGININDCLEKREIITRLMTRGQRVGSS